jgi:hypothetical protein
MSLWKEYVYGLNALISIAGSLTTIRIGYLSTELVNVDVVVET